MKFKEVLIVLGITLMVIGLLKSVEQYNVISFIGGLFCNWFINTILD